MSEGDETSLMLRELLLSWDVKRAIELALEDPKALRALFSLLGENDERLRIRTLGALREILRNLPPSRKKAIVKEFLDDLISVAKEGSEVVALNTLRVLMTLVYGFPLSQGAFLKLINLMKEFSDKSGPIFIELFSLASVLRVYILSRDVLDELTSMITSRDLRRSLLGLRLLLTAAEGTRFSLIKRVLEEVPHVIEEAMGKKDAVVADLAFDLLSEISRMPLREDYVEEFIHALTVVKNIALGKESDLKWRAKQVLGEMEEAVYRYYRDNPEAAKERIQRLLINERFYEAIDLALAVGDAYVLKWLSELLERMEETLRIGERVVPKPYYPSPPAEKLAERTLQPPTLKNFRPRKREAMRILRRAAGGGEVRAMRRSLGKGEIEDVEELAFKRPEVVLELVHMLRSSDQVEKMDALWAVSKLAERLDGRRLKILSAAVDDLIELTLCRNRWVRAKAGKALALIAAKSDLRDEIVGKFLSWYRSGELDKVAAALEFFSYYFLYRWDREAAMEVIPSLPSYLRNGLEFEGLLTIEAIISTAPGEEIELVAPLISEVKRFLKSDVGEKRQLAERILQGFKERAGTGAAV
ncbi:hypothetical protein [Thermococcus sp.]|uniref:hypothetical protein n=2 Tax=Thermococcus sp. TaxID=35749 RepID=UPI00260E1BAE|nr:hypothetical protein [Thermococcus sp.]